MKSLKSIFLLSAVLFTLYCCSGEKNNITFQKQHYYYSNTNGNNSIEGQHIYIQQKKGDTLFFNSEIDSILFNLNNSWILGQGSGKPYFDTGKEKFWTILKVLPKLNALIIRPLNSDFNIELPVVFWKLNTYPVKFSDSLIGSWGFSKIIFDKKDSFFKTQIFECDTDVVNLYLAKSKDLNSWSIKHLLSPSDFKNIPWNAASYSGEMKVTPLISDVIFHKGVYYSFVYGDDAKNKTYISVLTSKSLDGPYKINPNPILSPNPKSEFSNQDVYFPKVVKHKNLWIMYYTSKNKKNEEFICEANSTDLIHWDVKHENILPRNNGWNSGMKNLLSAQIKIINNQIHIWATGIKDVGDFNNPNKGNAMDVCIGKFYKPIHEISFIEESGNPIFGGNPTFNFENDHIGGAFQEIEFEGYKFTFYHGKGRSSKNYTILLK